MSKRKYVRVTSGRYLELNKEGGTILRGKWGPFFATSYEDFERIMEEQCRDLCIVLGLGMQECTNLVAIVFWAFEEEAKKPEEVFDENTLKMYKNWVPGGRTKNLRTGRTEDGVSEFAFQPFEDEKKRIISVKPVGHVKAQGDLPYLECRYHSSHGRA